LNTTLVTHRGDPAEGASRHKAAQHIWVFSHVSFASPNFEGRLLPTQPSRSCPAPMRAADRRCGAMALAMRRKGSRHRSLTSTTVIKTQAKRTTGQRADGMRSHYAP